jgi:hypothetical protein
VPGSINKALAIDKATNTTYDAIQKEMQNVMVAFVSRDTTCIAFLLAALNDLDILSANVGNAYFNAPTREKFGKPSINQVRATPWHIDRVLHMC